MVTTHTKVSLKQNFLIDRMQKKPGWNVKDMIMKQTQQAYQPLQTQLDKKLWEDLLNSHCMEK